MTYTKNQTEDLIDVEIPKTRKSRVVTKPMVTWRKEEKDTIVLQLIVQFEEKKLPVPQCIVTERALMIAQIAVLDEDRFRGSLNKEVLAEFQNEVDKILIIEKKKTILESWEAFTKENMCTPLDFIATLRHNNEIKTKKIATLEGELFAFGQKYSSLSLESKTMRERILNLEKVAGNVISSSSELQEVIIYCGNIDSVVKTRMEKIADITWITSKEGVRFVCDTVRDKNVILLKDKYNSLVSRSIRSTAKSCTEVFGNSTNLENALKKLVSA